MRGARPVRFTPAVAAFAVLACCLSCVQPRSYTTYEYVYPIEREVGEMNRVAYPEGSYTVTAGDTAASVAKKLGVDLDVLMEANAIGQDTALEPGDVLVIPRVGGPARQGTPIAKPRASEVAAGAAAVPEMALVSPAGELRALSAGTVIAVYRKYTSLISQVICEGIEQGLLKKELDPELTAITFIALHDGVLYQWIVNRDSIDAEEYVRTFRKIFFAGVMKEKT